MINAIAPIMTTPVYVTRYFFIGMHLIVIAFVSGLLKIFDYQGNKAKIVIGPLTGLLCVFLIYNQNINYGNPFLFNIPYDADDELTKLVDEQNVMVFSSDSRDFYSLIVSLRSARQFFYMNCTDDSIIDLDSFSEPFYVMVDKDSFPDEELNGDGTGGFVYYRIGVSGSIYDYLKSRLDSNDNREFEYIRDFNSDLGEYKIYLIK